MTSAIGFLGKTTRLVTKLATDIVLRYTRQVILSGTSPYLSRGQLRSIDLELTAFEESLPEELQLNDNRIMIMWHSDETLPYQTLHTLLFSCRFSLQRLLIPGIRDAVSPEAGEMGRAV